LSFTVAETCSFLYMSLLSDRIGLLRSAYSMTAILVIAGFLFGSLCTRIKLVPALLLMAVSVFGIEIMFIALMAYMTTAAVTDNPSLMCSILWTSMNIGKAIWVAVGPTVWQSMGDITDNYTGSFTNQFGLTFMLTSLIILIGVIIMEMGQQSTCRAKEKRLF